MREGKVNIRGLEKYENSGDVRKIDMKNMSTPDHTNMTDHFGLSIGSYECLAAIDDQIDQVISSRHHLSDWNRFERPIRLDVQIYTSAPCARFYTCRTIGVNVKRKPVYYAYRLPPF